MFWNTVGTKGWNLLLALSALIAAVLGADKLGVRLLPSGKEAGFSWNSAAVAGKPGLQLWVHEGDMNCVLRLQVENADAKKDEPDQFTARLKGYPGWPDRLLTVDKEPDGWLDIHQRSATVDDPKFTWFATGPVEIEHTAGPLQTLKLTNWQLVPKDQGGYDSKGAQTYRSVIFWLFLISLLPLFYQMLKSIGLFPDAEPPGPQAATPEGAVAALIANVTGSDARETRRIQTLLRQVVVQGQTAADVLDSLGVTDPAARADLWRKATTALNRLIARVNLYRRYLV